MINDLISELKQYNVTPEKLEKACEALPEDDLLGRKLRDKAKDSMGTAR